MCQTPHFSPIRRASLLALLTVAAQAAVLAQAPADATARGVVGHGVSASQGSAAPAEDITVGLPKFLLVVPGGKVEMGLTIDELADAASQVTMPARPDMAMKLAQAKVKTAIRRSASLLGHTTTTVEPFLLGKWNVKNNEYLTFVERMRAQQKKMRVPFHWWRFGRKDDFEQKLEAINKEFPKDDFAVLNYWERYGDSLPYKVATEKGESIADMPVTYVTFAEANAFAASLGMRLPTEAEWLRAARGDQRPLWPAGSQAFGEPVLKALQQYNSRDQVLKPTGTVAAATGPFGHLDMHGQIWQFISSIGLTPISGKESFDAEWKKVGKHKVAALLESQPVWKSNVALAKGGSFLSFQEPIQLLVDARAPIGLSDVLEGLGFRLAKSLRPGYDLLYSLLRGPFNRGLLAEAQDFDLALQVGAERYELGADGFPTSYQAITFAPVNWLSNDKAMDVTKLLERAQVSPVLIGTLATTEPLAEPDVAAGHYSVQFRRAGMPRELLDALKIAHKEVQAEKKRQEKSKTAKPATEEGQEPAAARPWEAVIKKFGITEQDLADAAHVTDLKFVRIDGQTISTEEDAFLLSGLEGKVLAVIKGTNKKPAVGNAFEPELELVGDAKGNMVAKFRIGMPLKVLDTKRFADFPLVVTLKTTPPSAEKPWRLQSAK